MDTKRQKVALAVLDAVESKLHETKNFIDNTMEDECQKENISAEEVIFFTSLKVKCSLRKTFCSEYVKSIALS